MNELIFFVLLIAGSALYLKSIVDQRVELQTDKEDRIFAEILLPISRVVSKLTDSELEDFDCEILDALSKGYDQVVIVVRKYAWRHGIKISPIETDVMYKHIRGYDMTSEELEVYESIREDARNVFLFPGGLVICRDISDN